MIDDHRTVLALFDGEDCCCPCGCDDPYHIPSSAAARPVDALDAHPLSVGKKMRPINLFADDAPFVPAAAPPGRESPQLPQPAHAPSLTAAGEYTAAYVTGEAGFATGLMLDDATLITLSGGIAQIDHQLRIARTFTGTTNTSTTFSPSGSTFTPLVIHAAIDVSTAQGQPAPRGTYANNTSGATAGSTYPSAAAATAALQGIYSTALPTGNYLTSGAGPARSAANRTVNYTNTSTYQESDGIAFSGGTITPSPITTTSSGSSTGMEAAATSTVYLNADYTVTGTTFALAQTADEYVPVETDLRWMEVTYMNAGTQTRDDFLYSGMLPTSTGTYSAMYDRPAPASAGVISQALTFAGVLISSSIGLTGTATPVYGVPYSYGTDAIQTGVACTYKGDSAARYSYGRSYHQVWYDGTAPAPILPNTDPAYSFRSPVVNGHSFDIRPGSNSRTTDLINILFGREVWINGTLLGNTWESWSAFQGANGITLLLEDSNNLTVVPGLDVTKMVIVDWASFFASIRRAGDLHLTLSTHTGHNTFPEDRAYLLNSARNWLALGSWDAYRDVPAVDWQSAGLSKPKTRAKFLAGQMLIPSAPIPTPPVHGLALLDVY